MCRSVQHSHFTPSRCFAQTVYMIYVALASAAPLWVRWRGGSSSLFVPAITGTFGICPVLVILRRCPPFVNLFCGFHASEHIVGLPVGPCFKVPALEVQLFFPPIRDGVSQYLVEIFFLHILVVVGSWEGHQVVIQVRNMDDQYLHR